MEETPEWRTPEADTELVRLRNDDRKAWATIGRIFGVSKTATHRRYTELVAPEDQVQIVAHRRKWSDEDTAEMQRLRNVEKRTFVYIAVTMGLTLGQVTSKFERLVRPSRRLHFEKETVRFVIPQRILDDRDRRMTAERDLTAAFFGDPPPGYSALERRA